MFLETIEYSMLSIANVGPYIPMYQLMKENVKDGGMVEKPVHEFDDENNCLVALDVKACAAIGNTLPYNIYHFVQSYRSTKEMMRMLIFAYEVTDEVKFVNKNNLNKLYEHFFQQ